MRKKFGFVKRVDFFNNNSRRSSVVMQATNQKNY